MERSGDGDDDVVDFRALERELRSAVEAERRRGRESDAKLRAVSQRTATFEEFRDIVLASRLTPLSKDDKRGASRTAPWNPLVSTPPRGEDWNPLVSTGHRGEDWNPLVSTGHRGEDGSEPHDVSDAHKLAASAATDAAGLTSSEPE